MSTNRQLFFKLEKLDSLENVIEEKSVKLISGRVDVSTGATRRKCTFELVEPLPDDWQSNRWKLYYGYRDGNAGDPTYVAQGVFIPINPNEKEAQSHMITSFQGIDKSKLFTDFQLDEPISFASGTTVRSIVQTIAGWFAETKLLLEVNLGTLAADFTFEEGGTAEQLMSTLLTSFNAEWFYDSEGFLVARRRTNPQDRPVRFVLDDIDAPVYLTSEQSIDDANYYNKLTLVGGKVDTDIFRATLQDDAAIARAGGRIVKKYFTRDAAVTQDQVDSLVAYYLSQGVLLPSQIRLTTLVLPEMEVDDIVQKAGRKYEVKTFNVPLSLGTQIITAGELL